MKSWGGRPGGRSTTKLKRNPVSFIHHNSSVYNKNRIGSSMDPWGTPSVTSCYINLTIIFLIKSFQGLIIKYIRYLSLHLKYNQKLFLGRRRCATMDGQKMERKRQKIKKKVETLGKIREGNIFNFSSNEQNRQQQALVDTIMEPGPSTSSYSNNMPLTSNIQTERNYNQLVAKLQCELTFYYPSNAVSHISQADNTHLPTPSTQSQNFSNVDDIMDLNPICMPFEVDVEDIIKKELEIDGQLDFI